MTWSEEASNQAITPEMQEVVQSVADGADVDLVLSSGRRGAGNSCSGSLHNCGNAVDIKEINGVDVGEPGATNPRAAELVARVQGVALGMSEVAENYGPMGLWKSYTRGSSQRLIGGIFGEVSYFPNGDNVTLWDGHQNHIHLGIHP